MKKIIGIFVLVFFVFIGCNNVLASKCNFSDDGYTSDSDINATRIIEGISSKENGIYAQNYCGPYFSYNDSASEYDSDISDDTDHNTAIFIKLTGSAGIMYRINTLYRSINSESSSLENGGFTDSYIYRGVGWYQNSDGNNLTCPDYIRKTGKTIKKSAGDAGITGEEDFDLYENATKGDHDFFYQKDVVTCKYNNGADSVLITYFKNESILRVYSQKENYIIENYGAWANIGYGTCPKLYVIEENGAHFMSIVSPPATESYKTYTGSKLDYQNHMDNKYKSLYLFNWIQFDENFKNCLNKEDETSKSNCMSEVNRDFSDTINSLSVFCNDVYSRCNYNDDATTYCLEMDKKISELMKQYNLKGEKCGLSSRLIFWFANIVKWVKYIAPVIAIILGILDFIKAIISSSDDDMKKSQGKFVKRLIAAALLFIVPFIIEFVLDKFNIVSDYCNII